MDRKRLLFISLAMEWEADLNRFFDDINMKVVFLKWTEGTKLVIDNPFGPY